MRTSLTASLCDRVCVCCVGRNEVRSSFNLWSTVLAETRKLSRERASLAETLASEMVARLDIMAKDVHILTKKVGQSVLRGDGVYMCVGVGGGRLAVCVLRSCSVSLVAPGSYMVYACPLPPTPCLILLSSPSSAERYVQRCKITF